MRVRLATSSTSIVTALRSGPVRVRRRHHHGPAQVEHPGRVGRVVGAGTAARTGRGHSDPQQDAPDPAREGPQDADSRCSHHPGPRYGRRRFPRSGIIPLFAGSSSSSLTSDRIPGQAGKPDVPRPDEPVSPADGRSGMRPSPARRRRIIRRMSREERLHLRHSQTPPHDTAAPASEPSSTATVRFPIVLLATSLPFPPDTS